MDKPVELVSMTDLARQQAVAFRRDIPQYRQQVLRLYLDGKGCDGFYYGVAFDDLADDDLAIAFEGFDLVIDPETLKFVKGSVIDWVDDERGRGFLVENPNHRKFRGKFYKRKGWEKRLDPT